MAPVWFECLQEVALDTTRAELQYSFFILSDYLLHIHSYCIISDVVILYSVMLYYHMILACSRWLPLFCSSSGMTLSSRRAQDEEKFYSILDEA